jgi:hypothetical protein
MTVEKCKALVPVWASEDEPTPPPRQTPPRFNPQDWFHDFKIKNGIGMILLFAWAASMMIGCITTGVIVRHNTTIRVTEEVTSQLRSDFQRYLDQQETERKAAQFLSGDASFEAAVEGLAGPMAQVIATYSMDYGVTQEGLYTIGWVFCARYARNSTEFGRTPQEILEKDRAWEGKVVGHAVRPQDTELSREIARAFLSGEYPDDYTTALTFFTREAGGKIIARNELFTGPYTVYWWMGK